MWTPARTEPGAVFDVKLDFKINSNKINELGVVFEKTLKNDRAFKYL